MMSRNCLFLFAALILLAPASFAQSASEVFEDPEGKFVLTLPAGWLAIVTQDALGRKDVNIVFKVRENGALKIRRLDDANPDLEVIALAQKDEEQTLRFLPGYDKLNIEKIPIGGASGRTGALVSYDYKNGGQPFTGRDYFVRMEDKSVYVLRFRGRKTILGTLRSHTDAITRSFKLKKDEPAPAVKP
ncbi:MAG: hypothetical protein ACKVX9_07450 [Blastocatellia bacterium]